MGSRYDWNGMPVSVSVHAEACPRTVVTKGSAAVAARLKGKRMVVVALVEAKKERETRKEGGKRWWGGKSTKQRAGFSVPPTYTAARATQ